MQQAQPKDGHTGEIRVHIDERQHMSPNPTTGRALYALGEIGDGFDLFKEVDGDQEDPVVPRDATEIHLKEDEHFHSQKLISIFVNSDEHEVKKKEISYAQVVDLYLGSGGKPSNEYLVKFSRGPVENPSGTLAPGQKVFVKDDMRFRVAGTGES